MQQIKTVITSMACVLTLSSIGPMVGPDLQPVFGTLFTGAWAQDADTHTPPVADVADTQPSAAMIDFGDDSSFFANDGECDDPRFAGPGVHTILNANDEKADATDCRTAFMAGQVVLAPHAGGDLPDIDFGDNSGMFAGDGECDDPRFSGQDVAPKPSRSNIRRDADDCRAALVNGTARFDGELTPLHAGEIDGVNYGENTGNFADDGECDDPRFSGENVAATADRGHALKDAHDCYLAVSRGTAQYDGELPPLFSGTLDGVDFGDNSGGSPDDGECDDPRFRGPGMAQPSLAPDNVRADAHDCQWHLARGFVELVTIGELFTGSFDGIDFGDNSGSYVDDGECDDNRFEGPGLGSEETRRTDANDCKIAYERGEIILKSQAPAPPVILE